jgi:hypothetical protein
MAGQLPKHGAVLPMLKSPEFGAFATPASVVLPRPKSISISKEINRPNY